jgi:glutaminase
MFDHTLEPTSPVGAVTIGDEGGDVTVALRGELDFVAMEQVVHDAARVLEHAGATMLRFDLDDVTRVAPVAERLLQATVRAADASGIEVRFVNVRASLGFDPFAR